MAEVKGSFLYAMKHVPHFEEEGRINRDASDESKFWLPLDAYAKALDVLVITCVDILFVHQNTVLLGKRNRHPLKGWWVIGGRMFAGESPVDAAWRKAKSEAGVDLERSRFQFFGAYSTVFALRHQEPQHHGLHSLNLAHSIDLTTEEKAQIHLTNTEYDTWTWVQPEEVTHLLNPDHELDRALFQVLEDLWAARR